MSVQNEIISFEIESGRKSKLNVHFPGNVTDPVTYFFKNGQMWALDIAKASLPFWSTDSVILDIGAHIGSYSLLASSYTKNKVIAIEASPQNFQFLKLNKEANNLDNLEIHNIGAGDKECVLKFIEGEGPGGRMAVESDEPSKIIEVKCSPLDTVLGGLDRLDFVKMDIEGYEINAIDGMKDALHKFHPAILFECNGHTLKFFDHTVNDLFRKLEAEFGYQIFTLIGDSLLPVNCYEPFPFGVCDSFALTQDQVRKISHKISRPLSFYQRVSILNQTEATPNNDIKEYVKWYKERVFF